MNFGQDWLKPCYWTNTLKTPLCYINNVLIRVIRVTLTLPVFRSVSEIRNSETCFSSAFISYQTYYIYDSVCFHWTKISGSSCERYLMWNREKKNWTEAFSFFLVMFYECTTQSRSGSNRLHHHRADAFDRLSQMGVFQVISRSAFRTCLIFVLYVCVSLLNELANRMSRQSGHVL